MAQLSPRFCPQCGTPVPPGQRFCSNCGTVMDAEVGQPTSASSDPRRSQVPDLPTQLASDSIPGQADMVPPPPPLQSFPNPSAPPLSYTNYPTEAEQSYAQSNPAAQSVPAYAKPQKDSSKSVLGQIGCGVLVVILLVLAICGVSGYFAVRWFSGLANSVQTPTTGNSNPITGNGAPDNNATPTIAPISQQMNVTVTYSSVVLTISNVQEASSFSDEANTSNPVLLRVSMSEHNLYTGTVFLSYYDNFRLILPDGTSVVPLSEQNGGGIDQAVNRQNWIDFPLTSKIDISKLTLQIGAPTQAQMSIPLTGNADVSKYQDKTITPKSSFQYAGPNWTLTSATYSWSANGKQATTGMRYVTVNFKVDNSTSNTYYPSPGDNMRLQEGSSVNSPSDYTFNPVPAGTTGSTGTVTFLVPQGGNSFTLVLLAQPNTNPPVTQVTQTFQF